MKYEIVTVGRRVGIPERNNARYAILDHEPKIKVGDIKRFGDYDVEVVYIKRIFEKGEYV